jgi:homoserine O-acetyltransferase
VLICHPLTCDQFVAESHPVTGKEGWWESLVGPARCSTRRASSSSASTCSATAWARPGRGARPASNQPWNLRFPVVTIADMVRAQAALLDHLRIPDLFCVIGGSMGGMQVLEWAASYPRRVFSAVPIACAAHHSAQNIAFHEVGRQAIMADPDWKGGDYRCTPPIPRAASPWRA